jgi:hypothetical protein
MLIYHLRGLLDRGTARNAQLAPPMADCRKVSMVMAEGFGDIHRVS